MSLLWQFRCHTGALSVTCHPSEVTFPSLSVHALVMKTVTCLNRDIVCGRPFALWGQKIKGLDWVASFKSRLVLPFWNRHTQVVLEKRRLNGCSSSWLALTTVVYSMAYLWHDGVVVSTSESCAYLLLFYFTGFFFQSFLVLCDDYADHISFWHTHAHMFNSPFSGTTWVSRYEKGKTNLDFADATDSE